VDVTCKAPSTEAGGRVSVTSSNANLVTLRSKQFALSTTASATSCDSRDYFQIREAAEGCCSADASTTVRKRRFPIRNGAVSGSGSPESGPARNHVDDSGRLKVNEDKLAAAGDASPRDVAR